MSDSGRTARVRAPWRRRWSAPGHRRARRRSHPSDDHDGPAFALRHDAARAGGSDETPPEQLDAAIVFAPEGALVPTALRTLAAGGTPVLGGIRKSDIPSLPYELLWHERSIPSGAKYPLADAARALDDLRSGRFTGAAVVVP